MKKLLSALLILFSVLSLASCGKPEVKEKKKVTLQNVYLSEKIPLPEGINYYNDFAVSGDNVFIRGSKDIETTDEEGNVIYKTVDAIYSASGDLSDVKEIFLYESAYEWNDETYESKNTYLNTIEADGKGGLWVSISLWHSYVDEATEEWIYDQDFEFFKLDRDGNRTESMYIVDTIKKIEGIDETELSNLYVEKFLEAPDGTLFVKTSQRLVVLNSEGELVNSYFFDNYASGDCAVSPDGKFRLYQYNWENETTEIDILEYDLKANEFKKLQTIVGDNEVIFSTDGNVYINDRYVVRKLDPETGKETPVLDWINSDINCDRIYNTVFTGDAVYTFEQDRNYEKSHLLKLTPASSGDTVEKYVITLAAADISYELKDMIVDYNRSSEDYRISVKVYGWSEDDTASFDRDLLAGNVPDIVYLDSLDPSKYVSKGLFADLYTLMDDELNVDDLLQNVLKAAEIDGGLYRLPISYTLSTLIGKTSIVGEGRSWTWQELFELSKKYPNAKLFDELDREQFMLTILPLVIDDFVDYEKGTTSFTDGNFKLLLEYAKTLPAEIDWDTYWENIDWEAYDSRFKEDRVLLQQAYIYNIFHYTYNRDTFGDEISYVGYPTLKDNGSVISFGSQFAIGADSVYKEQAWDFMKMLLGEDYQTNYVWDIPVNKAAFEKKKQQVIDDLNMDWDGDDGIADDDFFVDDEIAVDPVPYSLIAPLPTPEGPDNVTDEAYSEVALRMLEEITEIATTATKLSRNNDPVIDIIKSEYGAFFDSKKSAEETCKIIDSRVKLYLSENM